jgi:hypothetical protein
MENEQKERNMMKNQGKVMENEENMRKIMKNQRNILENEEKVRKNEGKPMKNQGKVMENKEKVRKPCPRPKKKIKKIQNKKKKSKKNPHPQTILWCGASKHHWFSFVSIEAMMRIHCDCVQVHYPCGQDTLW